MNNRILVFSLVALVCGAAQSNPSEALIAFDGFCIATGGDFATIERMAIAAKAIHVPSEVLNHDPVMAKFGGKGFGINRYGMKFMVAITPRKGCTLMFVDIDATALREKIEQNYPLAKPYIENSGPQKILKYRMIEPSMDAGSYIMLMTPKPGFDSGGMVSLGYISKDAAAKNRIDAKQ